MKVIIPVAGKGTRMRPFTHTMPKSLLPIAGKPVIEHILDVILPLKPTEVVFITGHLKYRFEEEMRLHYPTLACSFVEQKIQRGTADAIWTAHEAFDEPVLIAFSDTIFDADLSVINDSNDDAIIWTMTVEDYQRFGVVVTDSNGYMTRMVEKPKEPISKNANIGLYYVRNTKLLAEGIQHVFNHPIPGRELYLTDAFQYMVEHGAKIRIAPVYGWYDTGTTQQTLQSNRELLDKSPGHAPKIEGVTIIPPVAIDPTAILENSTIGPHVSIAARAHITNSKIANSIIDQGAQLHDAELTDSIVGVEAHVRGKVAKVSLGDHSRVE